MEQENVDESIDVIGTSLPQVVVSSPLHGDSKVETLDDSVSKGETLDCVSKDETLDSASKVETLDDFVSKDETLDSASKDKTLDSASMDETYVDSVSKENVVESIDVGTSLSQVNDSSPLHGDSKVQILDSVSSNVETLDSVSSNVETLDSASRDATLDSDETLDCVSSKVETLYSASKEPIDVGTSLPQVNDSSPVREDSKVETIDSASEDETLDCISKVETLDSASKVETLDVGTSLSQVNDDSPLHVDSKVETPDSDSSKVETSDSASKVETLDVGTSLSQVNDYSPLHGDSKVETVDSVSSKEETLDSASMDESINVGTSLNQVNDSSPVHVDSKVEAVDSVSSKEETLDPALKDESIDSFSPKVETLDSVSSKDATLDCIAKAQTLKAGGNKLFQKRDYEGAMLRYGQAIKLLPKDHVEVSHIRAYIASCYMQMEPPEYAKAILECDLALDVTPDHTKALLKRARCYEAMNKLDLALKDVYSVSELDPNNPMAADINDKLERTLESKGLTVIDSVIELSPDYVEPVEASPALWAEEGKIRVKTKKKNRSNYAQEISESEDTETEKKIKRKWKRRQLGNTSKERVEDVKKTVKFVYSDDIRFGKLPVNCTLFELREVVQERFPNLRSVHIKYKDQEGDLVTITTDEELRMCCEVSSKSSLSTLRFYVVEVSPEQDPFFGRLVEMKKSADSFKRKLNRKGTMRKTEDWMIEFARLFKIQAKVDSDTTKELETKLNPEAMEEVLTSNSAQEHFDKAAHQFQEMAARSLLKLGNVHVSGARKKLSLLQGVSVESLSEEVKTAYEWSLKEHMIAKEKYEEAIKIKPDLFEVFLASGLQQFEEARLSWYYVLFSHVDLKTWPYADVVQLYQFAESNIKKFMEGLKNTKSETSRADGEEEASKLKLFDVLLCVVVYERSIMEYKLDIPIWRENFEAAMDKYALAGTCNEDDPALISVEYVADNTLRDLRFHMEEIVEIFNEMNEAKQWRDGFPSDRLEEILTKRTANIFHVSKSGTP